MEHLGLILGSQKQADALLKHFGSLNQRLAPLSMSSYPSFHVLKHFAWLVLFGWAPSRYERNVNL
jgi:hypothetical protein